MSKIDQVEKAFARQELPEFRVGDTVDVHVRIREGDKDRVQVFNGTVIRKRGRGTGATFTVRRIVQGQGLERIFPLHSPFVTKVEVVRTGRVRRAKLYYLRERTGKATRLKEVMDKRVLQGRAARKKKTKRPAAAPAPRETAPAAEEAPAQAVE